jgi:hypothetical protein
MPPTGLTSTRFLRLSQATPLCISQAVRLGIWTIPASISILKSPSSGHIGQDGVTLFSCRENHGRTVAAHPAHHRQNTSGALCGPWLRIGRPLISDAVGFRVAMMATSTLFSGKCF